MPVTSTAPAPYAPATAVLDIVKRYRSKGLPSPVTSEVLGRAGVSSSLIPRTIQTLQALDLIDDKGVPSATFEGLRLAPEAEYQERLGQWLNAAYADVLKYVDPASATEIELRDAFRSYNPIGQQGRMVTLFSGLYAAAGVAPEREASTRKPRARKAGVPSVSSKRTTAKVNQEADPTAEQDRGQQSGKGQSTVNGGVDGGDDQKPGQPSPFERELLGKFPPFNPEWTEEIQAKWFTGFDKLMSMAPKR